MYLCPGVLSQAQQGRTQAESALDLAEQRRNDAEQLIRFMLGDFATQLRPIGRLDLLDEIAARWELAYAHNNLGTLAEGRNRPLVALDYFQESARIRLELVEASGAAGMLGLANNLSWVGRVQNALGELVQAWQSSAQALDTVINASRQYPDDARLMHAEINFRLNLARLSERLGLIDAAESLLAKAVAQASQDVAIDPTHSRRRAMLTIAALLIAALDHTTQSVEPAMVTSFLQQLERVPDARRNDLRYTLAQAVLSNPESADRLDAMTRFNHDLAGLQAEIINLPIFKAIVQ